jgi:hypothetical protein
VAEGGGAGLNAPTGTPQRRAGTGPAGTDRAATAAPVVALAAVLAALGIGALVALAAGWDPVSDLALMEMRVRDVPDHLPLLGAYSRFGWAHPGPAWTYGLAVPYRLIGSVSAALMIGALAAHAGALVAAWWAARREDVLAAVLVLAALAVVLAGRTPIDVRNPWNPYVGLVATGALVVLAWSAGERRPIGAALLLPVGSVLVQAHVGHTPVVVAVSVAAVVAALAPRSPGEPDREVPRRAALAGVLAAAALWVPPVVQQLSGDSGNVGVLVRELGGGEDRPVGWDTAFRLWSEAFALPPSWAGAPVATELSVLQPRWSLPVLAAIPLAASVVAVRRRDRRMCSAMAIAWVAIAAGVVAVARATGSLYEYVVPWIGAVAAVAVALGAWVLCRGVRGGLGPATAERATLAVAAVAVVAAVVIAVGQFDSTGPDRETEEAVAALLTPIRTAIGDRPVLVTNDLDLDAAAAAPGVALALEREGVDVRLPLVEARRAGGHRVASPDGRVQVLLAPVDRVAQLQEQGWRSVGVFDPFTADERLRIDELTTSRDALSSRLAATSDPAERERMGEDVLDLVDRVDEVRRGRISLAALVRD